MIDRIEGFMGTTLAILFLSALSAGAISLLLSLLFGFGDEYWLPVGWVVAAMYGAAFQQRLTEVVGDE